MIFVLFSKNLKSLSIHEHAQFCKEVGLHGFDLAIRPGYPVNPENVESALPPAAKAWKAEGLSVSMATLPGDLTDPRKAESERIVASCAAAGCKFLKLGYWPFKPGQDYWKTVDLIRWDLSGWQCLAEKHGVKICHHIHSGRNYGCNASAATQLVKGFDPRFIGIYLDPCHLAFDGEDYCLALTIVRDYLTLCSIKNCAYSREEKGGRVLWRKGLVPVREGLVPYRDVLPMLIKDFGFDGVFSFHSEYSNMTIDQLKAITKQDVACIREILVGMGLKPLIGSST
jgi:sugar phosphate isomerase/epimerase